MITGLISTITLLSILSSYSIYTFKPLILVKILFELSLILLFSVIFFFTFDKSLVHSFTMEDIKDVTKNTLEDITELTTISTREVPPRDFEKDEVSRRKNKRLFLGSVITICVVAFMSFVYLFMRNDNFTQDLKRTLLRVAAIKVIQVYFIFAFKNNYRNQSVEELRKALITKYKDV